ncbi:MAG TPA: HAMP domain-containing sensor histidine kinase [Candidatus Eisenbacteria bacterium]|nr:HAMP domain-containing sensor histidine kinase [Candidatus Eisenbacteria bacterium]
MATPSPSADELGQGGGPPEAGLAGAGTSQGGLAPADQVARKRRGPRAPQTFQARLTLAFVALLAITIGLVGIVVVNRLGEFFDQQQRDDLAARARSVAQYVVLVAEAASPVRPVVSETGVVDPSVSLQLGRPSQQRILADRLGQADVQIRLGRVVDDAFIPATDGDISISQEALPGRGQAREPIRSDPLLLEVTGSSVPYVVEVTLSNPYTFRASAITSVTGLLAIIGLVVLGVAVVIASAVAQRFTTPLRRLTDASRDLAAGDLARRVPADAFSSGAIELSELAHQFNAMAERVQESIDIIRNDRDRSREFLADVSHELRTPIAALRTFNELLVERAGNDPATRTEFLEASGVQLERLDWLAQNLLELSKLDSGLVLLDLRPEDLRSTVEQAVDQATPTARRRGVNLSIELPEQQVRVRHDPVRIGQVVTNLVGNAVKFSTRGGHVRVNVAADEPRGARITVADSGVGIDPAELPRIFDRFFRGSRASEARGSGSGLGLAIVRSIVEMHGGTVAVESRLGLGSTFSVWLPRDPRQPEPGDPMAVPAGVVETSPSPTPNLNPRSAE